MRKDFQPGRLDVAAFAEQNGELSGADRGADVLHTYRRLVDDALGLAPDQIALMEVAWQARGELTPVQGANSQVWLHLRASGQVLQTCQRCLQPVEIPVALERHYRFVADEATASRDDADLEEDLLVTSRQFNLTELIEDELLMGLPLVARHEQCPVELPAVAASAGYGELTDAGQVAENSDKPNPFAMLASLKLPPA